MTTARTERRGLLRSFAVFGAFWGAWVVALPAIREQVGVDDGRLGVALGAIAVAALPAMPVAGRLMDARGPRQLLPALMLAFAAASALSAFATGLVSLVLTLLALGAVTGAFDVVLNTATASWERREARPLMTLAHAWFSVGVLIGSVLTGVARDLGAGPRLVLGTVALVLAGTALTQPAYHQEPGAPEVADALEAHAAGEVASAAEVAGAHGAPAAVDSTRMRASRRLPSALLALGLLIAAAFLLEDGVQSWSALHLERTLDAPPWVSGFGPGLFAGAMAAGRFASHRLTRPGSEQRTVALGGAALTAGLLLLALGPSVPVALAGMVLAGAGVSVLAPTLLSAVGTRSTPGRQGADLALVTAMGYSGFVCGPALVGLLSALTSLPTALAILAVLPAAVALLGPRALRPPPPDADEGIGQPAQSARACR